LTKDRQMIDKIRPVVSVAGMARLVGLSRQRFHQLMREGVFPPPVYDIATRRPHYTEELQQVCLSVKEKNFGINGRVVLFYARLTGVVLGKTQVRRSASPTRTPKHNGLIAGLKGLGLATITEQQIEAALKELYPDGTAGVGETELLRTIFVCLMRRN
jgi:hypothetical protein